ncbi:glycosyltransferase [Rhodococcus sp. Eu-32]|uniref:glycosyltransferase family 4 protein n=1 Tax=Rhodococcus sp. Eu-32 TaxID=1017319 RepID=UPI000DF2258A|nr:glycosyltransferase family 4 protein [Rhodococcus sp. Eu-32]RRQ29219.1 glycosyltransferase [Rhodococcus sp. Eu-32]
MSALRVAFVTESSQVWGAETSLLLLLQEFDKLSIEATTIIADQSPFAEQLVEGGLPFIRHKFAKHHALSSGSLSTAKISDLLREPPPIVKSALRLRKILKNFDVVVIFSLWQSAEVLLASKLARVQCVLDLHETFDGRFSSQIVKAVSQACAGVIAPSKSVLSSNKLEPGGAIIVVPRPVHAETQETFSVGSRRYRIGMFGQVVPHKRVDRLVAAVEKCGDDTVSVLVVGGEREESSRSSYEVDMRARLSQLEGSAFLNRVNDVGRYMKQCDVIVNLSDHEAFGRTVIEALQYGAYPVVVDGGGPAEVVRNVGVGLVLKTIEELEKFVCNLRADSTLGFTRERNDWHLKVAQYGPKQVAKHYVDVLEKLIVENQK